MFKKYSNKHIIIIIHIYVFLLWGLQSIFPINKGFFVEKNFINKNKYISTQLVNCFYFQNITIILNNFR